MQAFVSKLKRMRAGDALRRHGWFYDGAEQTLKDLEQADLSLRRDWTQERFAEVLWSAQRTRYGKQLRRTRAGEWPLLRKPQVQSDPTAFLAQPAFMAVKASTGGTSGAPLTLYRSLKSIVFEQACLDAMMARLGADARSARVAVLRTESIKDPNDFRPPYWVEAGGGQRLVFSSSHLNAATLDAYVEALERFRPDVMMGYPTSLEALCLLLRRAERCTHAPRVLSSSEMLHPHVWSAARERLGCRLLDYYGQAERVAFAYAVEPGEYRFLPGYARVEFEAVDSDASGQVLEIIGTPLWNAAMPLVRYCTGDLIRVPADWGAKELEELALGLRTFTGVLGRDGDILLTPEGVKVTGISHFQRDVRNILRIQVIQEAVDQIVILVLATPEYTERDGAKLLENVRHKLPLSMSVEVFCVDALERTARGKAPFVIHRPAVKQLLQQGRAPRGAA